MRKSLARLMVPLLFCAALGVNECDQRLANDHEPGDLTVLAISSSQVELSWREYFPATKYIVERRVSGSDSFISIAELKGGSFGFSDKGLAASTVYFYRLLVLSPNGTLESDTVSVRTENDSSTFYFPGNPKDVPVHVMSAWTGSEYGVIYYDLLARTYFLRLSSNAEAIGTSTRLNLVMSIEKILWTGSEYSLIGESSRYTQNHNNEIFFARLDQEGNPIGNEMQVSFTDYSSESPDMIWTGSQYGVTWNDVNAGVSQVYFTTISDLTVGSPVHPCVANRPVLAWTGSEYCLAAIRPDDKIFFGRYSSSGSSIGYSTFPATLSSILSLVWTGSGFGLSWGGSELVFARLSATGAYIGSEILKKYPPLSSYTYPRLAWTGSEYAITWTLSQHAGRDQDILFQRFSSEGENLGPEITLKPTPRKDRVQLILWTGSEFGIFGIEGKEDKAWVFFTRLRGMVP